MSHISSYQTEIRLEGVARGLPPEEDPGWEILKEAVEVVRRERRGRVGTAILDYFGQSHACDFAVITPDFPRGVGVTVSRTTGEVHFLADDYGGYAQTVRDICRRFSQAYAVIAVSRALRAMNYEVELEEHGTAQDRAVVVRGVL